MKIRVAVLGRGQSSTLSHTYKPSERVSLHSMVPYIVSFGDPSGTFTMTVKDADGNTVASKAQTVSAIKTAASLTNSYFHGWVKFELSSEVILYPGRSYTIELSSSGYTYSDSAYFGWGIEHEFSHNDFSDTINLDKQPLALKLWGYRSPRSR